MTTDCYACDVNAELASAPACEAILVEDGWRLAHAFNTSLPGWLVLLPTRHLASLGELSQEEAAAMGALLRRCSLALESVTNCAKSYFAFFGEAEGFAHLHVHVVPRMDWFTEQDRGPGVFRFLGVPQGEAFSGDDRDAMSLRLRDELRAR
jgi:diadenosine tetraphosphate (Ap4A) HIT family hydrolase